MRLNKILMTAMVGFALILTACKCEKNPNLNMNAGGISATENIVEDDAAVMEKTFSEIKLGELNLKGYANGFEESMIKFLNDGGYTNAADDEALKTVWYDFDRVQFEHGTTDQLMEGSENQLENLVNILNAFPETKVKIGGYTDKTGDAAVNLQISQARADYIKQWLSNHGVGGQVDSAEGYGSEFATVDADASDEERSIDRKMSVRFTK